MQQALGRHVAQGAVLGVGARDGCAAVFKDAREAEVGNVHRSLCVDDEVRRLDVAVHHLAAVGIGEGGCGLESGGRDIAQVLERVLVEPFAVHDFHRVVARAGALAGADHLYDVWVVQHGDDARFGLELVAARCVGD